MDKLKQFFPLSFGEKQDIFALVINLLIYFIVGAIGGLIISLLGFTGLGIILSLIGTVISLYCLVGMVLSCLDYFKVLK